MSSRAPITRNVVQDVRMLTSSTLPGRPTVELRPTPSGMTQQQQYICIGTQSPHRVRCSSLPHAVRRTGIIQIQLYVPLVLVLRPCLAARTLPKELPTGIGLTVPLGLRPLQRCKNEGERRGSRKGRTTDTRGETAKAASEHKTQNGAYIQLYLADKIRYNKRTNFDGGSRMQVDSHSHMAPKKKKNSM